MFFHGSLCTSNHFWILARLQTFQAKPCFSPGNRTFSDPTTRCKCFFLSVIHPAALGSLEKGSILFIFSMCCWLMKVGRERPVRSLPVLRESVSWPIRFQPLPWTSLLCVQNTWHICLQGIMMLSLVSDIWNLEGWGLPSAKWWPWPSQPWSP